MIDHNVITIDYYLFPLDSLSYVLLRLFIYMGRVKIWQERNEDYDCCTFCNWFLTYILTYNKWEGHTTRR